MKLSNLYIVFLIICSIQLRNVAAQVVAPQLNAVQTFSVLAAATVTNTGATVIACNVGVSPGTAVTGFPPGIMQSGQIYSGAASLAGAAMISANNIYTNLIGQVVPLANNLTGIVLGTTLGGMTLNPGVYSFSSSAQLTGTLTLNDGGDPNAVFIFKIGSTLTTASYSKVVMSSGSKGKNVFWQIGSSATLGTYTNFIGNIIALASITMTTGCTTTGKLLALNGAVTMDTNEVQLGTGSCSGIVDTDGDGVPDNLDEYPNDSKKAYNTYSSTSLGSTIAFEDQWPFKGDFDMNDMVVIYKYTIVTNANNIVVQVIGNFTLVATGGMFANGFGVQFPIIGSSVSNVVGASLEAGQDKAVIILFTNMRNEMANWNTVAGAPTSATKSYTVSFDVANGPTISDFGTDYNPFMLSFSGTSRHEVHLAGKIPTTLADKTVFGTGDDNTNLATGSYYVTKTGLPFAISLPTASFKYPIEQKDITLAYLHFAEWAQSGGTLFVDWYSNVASGYRNASLLY